MTRSSRPEQFLQPEEQVLVQQAIAKAEAISSAEVKLIILRHCWVKLHQKAVQLFKKHHLYETKERNAVLILLITTNREFLIHGDQGIHEKVGQSFWDETRDLMMQHFQEGELGLGLQQGIESIGLKLAAYFPRNQDDQNELDNAIIHEQ